MGNLLKIPDIVLMNGDPNRNREIIRQEVLNSLYGFEKISFSSASIVGGWDGTID
jgi:hypothetical protein